MRRVISLLLGRGRDAQSRHEVDRRVDIALQELTQVQRELEQIMQDIQSDSPPADE